MPASRSVRVQGSLAALFSATALAPACLAQGITCVNGAQVRVCVQWDQPTNPALGVDFTVAFTDPSAPTIALITGNGGWQVYAEAIVGGAPANIAELSINPSASNAKFGVKLAKNGGPGANNVGALTLIARGWSGHSSLLEGSNMAGDLTGVAAVQRSADTGGEVWLTIEGDGGPDSLLIAPVLRWLSIAGSLAGDVLADVVDGHLLVNQDVAATSFIDIGALGSAAFLDLGADIDNSDCAGYVLLRAGLPLYEHSLGMANLSGTIDLNGGDVGGWLEIVNNGSGDIVNGGRVVDVGAVTLTSLGVFSGSAGFAGVDGFTFVRIHGGVFDGALTLGDVEPFGYVGTHAGDFGPNSAVTVTGAMAGTIRVGAEGGSAGDLPGQISVQGDVGTTGLIDVESELRGSISVWEDLAGDIVVGSASGGGVTVNGNVTVDGLVDLGPLSNNTNTTLSNSGESGCAGTVLLRDGLPNLESLYIGNLSGTVDFNGGAIGGWFELEGDSPGDILNGGAVLEGAVITFTSNGSFSGSASFGGIEGTALVRIHGGVFDGVLMLDGDVVSSAYIGTHGGDFLGNSQITVTGALHGTLAIGADFGWTGDMPGAINVGAVGATGVIRVDDELGGLAIVNGDHAGSITIGSLNAGALHVIGGVASGALVDVGPVAHGGSLSLSYNETTQCNGQVLLRDGLSAQGSCVIGNMNGTVDFNGGNVGGWFELDFDSSGDVQNGGTVLENAAITLTSVGTFDGTAAFGAMEPFSFIRIHGGVFDGDLAVNGDVAENATIVTHGGDIGPNGHIAVNGSLAGSIWIVRVLAWTGDLPGVIDVSSVKGSGQISVEGTLTGALNVSGNHAGEIVVSKMTAGNLTVAGRVFDGALVQIDKLEQEGPGGPSVLCSSAAGAVFEGKLHLNGGIGTGAFVSVPGTLVAPGTIDLAGGGLKGTLNPADGDGEIANVGTLADGGLMIFNMPSGAHFSGQVDIADIENFGILRFEGGKVDGKVNIATDLAGLVMWGPGDQLAGGSLNIGRDVTATGQVRLYPDGVEFFGDVGGTIAVGRNMAGAIEAQGVLAATGRINISGQCTGSVELHRGMKTGSQINMRGLGAAGALFINSNPVTAETLGGTIRVDASYGGPPATFVTFDGLIRVNPQDLGTWQGTIRVVGCHQTADPLDICVCGTNQGTIQLAQKTCAIQVGVSCGDPCP